jgi:Zn-dependent peptidase ImmA (M78 family)
MRPRYSLAKRKAQDLLRKAGVTKAPVPVERIAVLADAELRFEPFAGALSGMVYRRDGHKAIIGVNSSHPTNRKRFTIAHELGHLLLHGDELHVDERFPFAFRDEISSKAVDPAEIEANQFAAELLMPETWLESDIGGRHLDIESDEVVEKLAKKYGVSMQSMTHRLTNLGAKR